MNSGDLVPALTSGFEQRAARLYSTCLVWGLLGLGVGLFWRSAVWLGVVALVVAPVLCAVLAWSENRAKPELKIGSSILLALLGLVLAVLLGFLARR